MFIHTLNPSVDIETLKKLTNLKTLNISDNHISFDQIESLRLALPNCKIDY